MDERKSMRAKDDDVPIIGDHSEARNAGLGADSRETQSPPRAQRADSRARDERLAPDPHDVRRHARLVRQREHRGPFAKALRYSPIALVAAVAFVVYWNFETLRGITVDYSALTSLFGRDGSVSGDDDARFGGGLKTVSVEAPVVVGDLAEASDPPDAPDAPDAQAVEASSQVQSATSAVTSTIAAAPASAAEDLADARVSPPPTPPVPPAPPVPETIVFAGPVNTVSESDAAAAVLILRNGGNRGASSFTWWTSDGTATAGVDYADLGRVVVQFAAGQQNRTIRIPIVGDRVVEQPETFYVHLATGEDADASERARTEVVIEDDD
jgi:hypothetical protein